MAQVSMRLAEAVDEWNHRHAPRWTFPLCKRLCDWREIQYGAPAEMVRAETGGWTTQFDNEHGFDDAVAARRAREVRGPSIPWRQLREELK